MSYGRDDVISIATKLGRLVNGGVIGYYAGGKTSEIMSQTLPERLIAVVDRHKKIQLGASLAQSFVPGAGVAASVAAVASLWKMYYDINQVLGIKISENAGKSLTSAVLTNLSSFAAKGVATAVSEGVKFIPVVGWLASAGISTVTTTAIIYGAAYIYMNALTAMYNAKGTFDLNYLQNIINDEEPDESNDSDDSNEILEVTIDHDVICHNTKGMLLHLKFNIYDQKDKECSVAIWVKDKNDEPIIDINGRFANDDGQVFAIDSFTPPYDATVYNDYQFFFPYAELHLEEKQDFNLLIAVFDSSQNPVVAKNEELTWNGGDKYIDNWHEFNVIHNGKKGMVIHTSFEVEDMKNKSGTILIRYKNAHDYSDCLDENGEEICSISFFTPNYDSCRYNDFEFFMPYSALSNVDNSFYYMAEIYNSDNELVLRGEPSDDIEWT